MDDELNELGERLFRQDIASRIYPQARQLVHAHRKPGHRVVLATSATPFQADPVFADMGFDAVLCTRPKVQAGMLTGEVDGDIPWGPGKARAVASYAHRESIRLADSFAYGNGTEDVPLLMEVGHPRPLNYVDRQDTQKAKEALQPAVDKLRRGISIAIAPEGTRSPTPVPGPFKKGGFHIAIQAGVPIIPVVIRNTGELMWRNSFWLHPGTVDVAVLEPVPTSGWTATDLDHHVAYVRQCFLQALDNWPGDASRSSGDHPPGDGR